MIIGISVKNFKGIRSIERLELGRFHVLVGPNGAGKTTLLQAINWVRDCLEWGPAGAVERSGVAEFRDLTWNRSGGEITVELWLKNLDAKPNVGAILHYSLKVWESLQGTEVSEESLNQFDAQPHVQAKVVLPSGKPRKLLGKTKNGTDFYKREQGSYQDSFRFGLDKLTLAHTPPDVALYPTANWAKQYLLHGVRMVQLDGPAMRLPCPATRSTELELDGSNLARAAGRLIAAGKGAKGKDGIVWPGERSDAGAWVDHLRYALPSLDSIGWCRRQPDNAEYLLARFKGGLQIPSWGLSDGTLRMLALTLPAYLPPTPSVRLIEEPENGVHPKALEVILDSLTSIPQGQLLMATHSPLVVQQCGVGPLLCLTHKAGETAVTPGLKHPKLTAWEGTPDLGTVFASGILA